MEARPENVIVNKRKTDIYFFILGISHVRVAQIYTLDIALSQDWSWPSHKMTVAARRGLEPRSLPPKGSVIPFHHRAIILGSASEKKKRPADLN